MKFNEFRWNYLSINIILVWFKSKELPHAVQIQIYKTHANVKIHLGRISSLWVYAYVYWWKGAWLQFYNFISIYLHKNPFYYLLNTLGGPVYM